MIGTAAAAAAKRPARSLKSHHAQPDWALLIGTLVLVALGIIMVFSSSQYFAQNSAPYYDSYYFLKSQLMNAAVGAAGMFAAYKINYRNYNRLSYICFFILLALLVFMIVSNKAEAANGAERWMSIFGFGFQPSELAKIVLPMALARWITINQSKLTNFFRGFLPAILIVGVVAGLIFLQKDLSSAVVVAVTGAIMIWCAGARFSHLCILGGLGFCGVVGAILIEPYRIDRVKSLIDPWQYAQDEGWQTVQSLMAIGSGGLSGVGLGSGGSKWFYLPERHTDFIFSVLCEELGFLGGVFVILLIAFIIWRGITIAVKAPSTYSSLLAVGLIGSIAVQSVVNLGVCTGLLPVTGVTLPFFSYGGTSLVVSMTMIGMLLNISRQANRA